MPMKIYNTPSYIIIWLLMFDLRLLKVVAVNCPTSCTCMWTLLSLNASCKHQNLTVSPSFIEVPVENLDLSYNQLIRFPRELSATINLVHLDLSNNHISYLSVNDLRNFKVLKSLILANNHITHWLNINPNTLLSRLQSLQHLSLSGNSLHSFSDSDPTTMLISKSLQSLELENCGITEVAGELLYSSLPNLKFLNLNYNPLFILSELPSQSLETLLVRNCSLQFISYYLLEGLSNLQHLDLSWNTNLAREVWNSLKSDTLTSLDVSYCSLTYVDSSQLEKLMHLNLRGNVLRSLSPEILQNNIKLQTLDVSYNAIDNIYPTTFIELQELTSLNLAYNQISKIDTYIFAANEKLTSVNLSHNIFEYFTEIASNFLLDLNLSWCEITDIHPNALAQLNNLRKLDLSHNLFKEFPNGLNSTTLKVLNLSNCRLISVNNLTFHQLPGLISLHLNGNQLTSSLSTDFFNGNPFLKDIWLQDNPWICICSDTTFLQFYKYLKNFTLKNNDMNQLKCSAPSQYLGVTWQRACQLDRRDMGTERKNMGQIITIIIICIALAILLICLFNGFQNYILRRRKRLDEREYNEICEEMRTIQLRNEEILREVGAPNASSYHEPNLPSYEDALRMPRPVRPIKSMSDLPGSSNRLKSTNIHYSLHPTNLSMAMPSNTNLDYGKRYCSEELLSLRNAERLAPIEPYRRSKQSVCNRQSISSHLNYPSARIKAQNLQSAEQSTD